MASLNLLIELAGLKSSIIFSRFERKIDSYDI